MIVTFNNATMMPKRKYAQKYQDSLKRKTKNLN